MIRARAAQQLQRRVRTLATARSAGGAADAGQTTNPPSRRYPGWRAVIGLELHVQLKGNLKLLSPSLAVYDAAPNTHVSPFDAALPGSLPRLGSEPVRLALLACLALKSTVNQSSRFDRKHYFYPDLPAGFQVTQKYSPLATGGMVTVRMPNADNLRVRIEQIQLEQDTAKSSHSPDTHLTSIDLNRAGAALIEIVTRPDMSSAEEAAAFVRALRAVIRWTGVGEGGMEKGELRCDVNVSVQRDEEGSELGTRCEIKNLNGVKFLMGAIGSEIKRQIEELEAGNTVVQATRGYDEVSGETFYLRSKAEAPDYRYMPDPELGEVLVSDVLLASLQSTLPELPDDVFDRLISQYSLSPRDAGILIALGDGDNTTTAYDDGEGGPAAGVRYFERVAHGREGKIVANWMINDLLGQLSSAKLSFANCPVSTEALGALIDAVVEGKLNGTQAKSILKSSIASSTSLLDLLASSSSSTSIDATSPPLTPILQAIVASYPAEVAKIRAGQDKVVMRLVGVAMKQTGGSADARSVRTALVELIGRT